jgi:hypothetical protein
VGGARTPTSWRPQATATATASATPSPVLRTREQSVSLLLALSTRSALETLTNCVPLPWNSKTCNGLYLLRRKQLITTRIFCRLAPRRFSL